MRNSDACFKMATLDTTEKDTLILEAQGFWLVEHGENWYVKIEDVDDKTTYDIKYLCPIKDYIKEGLEMPI